MMEMLIVMLAVILAAGYLVRRWRRALSISRRGCGHGCACAVQPPAEGSRIVSLSVGKSGRA